MNEERNKIKMVSGIPFSEREKVFIVAKEGEISHAEIAEKLGELYPEDNGGKRSRKGVQKFVHRTRDNKEYGE